MDSVKSPEQILKDAFHQIQTEHGIVLKYVRFDLFDDSRGFVKEYGARNIDFEATFSDKVK